MKNRFLVLTVIIFVMVCPKFAAAQSLNDIDLSIKKEENMLLKLQKDKKSTVKQLQSISNQIDNYKKLMRALSSQITANDKRIESIGKEVVDLNKNITKAKKDITGSNIFFIDNLGFSELTVVASAKTPSETLKTLEIISRAGMNLQDNVQEQSLMVFELEKLAEEEKARRKEALSLQEKRKDAVAKLEIQNKKQKDTLTLIKNDEAGRKEYVEMLKFQRQTLEDELKRTSALLKRRNAARPDKQINHPFVQQGTMVWPIQGQIIEPYGEAYIEDAGVNFFHKGIKIRPEKTTPIFSAAEGEIIFADYIRGFDNIMVVDHGDALYTVYGNLSEMKGEIGEKIQRGDVLGRIHVDLESNTSYLYFEIRKNDEALNPANWLAGYKSKINIK